MILADEQAHRLDSPETSSRPHLSSILDDTFYLLKLVLNRVLSCGSLPTLRSMAQKISEVMERDYTGAIKRKMEAVYGTQPSSTQERGGERDRREKDQRASFIVRLDSSSVDLTIDLSERPGRIGGIHGPAD